MLRIVNSICFKDLIKDKDGAKRCHPAIRTKPTAVYKYVNYYNTQKNKNKRYTLPIEQDQKLKTRFCRTDFLIIPTEMLNSES